MFTRKILSCLVLSVFVSGCAIVSDVVPGLQKPAGSSGGPAALISLGMTRQEVLAVMGKQVIAGYEIDKTTGATKPVVADSLYSTEILSLGGTDYLLDQFILPQEFASQGKFYPVVFQDEILVAKGQDGLEALKAKYQAKQKESQTSEVRSQKAEVKGQQATVSSKKSKGEGQ